MCKSNYKRKTKIFSRVNFKDKAERKAFIYSLLIFIITGQFVASTIWYLFDDNNFLGLLFASVAGFLFGYRGSRKKSRRKNINKSNDAILTRE